MLQFIHGSWAAFAALEERARRSCVRFENREMPPGATPARAAIAFEIDQASGAARLLVDRGITYTGPNNEVRAWFLDGQRSFENFAALRSWLATTLMSAFLPTVGAGSAGSTTTGQFANGCSDCHLDDLKLKMLQIALWQGRGKDELPS